MKKLLALLLSVLMMCSMIPFATVSAAEEITEPTIVISTVEAAEAGDEIEVTVNLKNIPEPGLIGAMVEIGFDPNVFELVTYYDEDEEMWFPQIEVGSKYNASSNKYITFASIDEVTGKSDRCIVKYVRGTATATQSRTEEHFFTATFRIKEDAPGGTYPLTVDRNDFVLYGNTVTDFAIQNATVTINQHDYVGVETQAPTCTTAGEMTYTCSECGKSYNKAIPSLGHSYGKAVEIVAPTCTTAGEGQSTCAVCGDVKIETVQALGHTDVDGFCSVCGAISGTAIVVSTVEAAEAGDEIEVTVNLMNIPEPGLIGAIVEIGFDPNVFELVTYYDEDEEMWLPQIEVGSKYNASSNKYITFPAIDEETGKSDRCFVLYTRGTATATQSRTEEHFFTATFRIKEDAPCGTYPLTVDRNDFVLYGNTVTDFAIQNATVTIHHEYVGVETQAPTCTTAGEMTYTCTSCEDSYTEAISPLGHKYDEVVILAPTCTAAGEKEYTCSACGDVKTESIPATHTYRADGNYAVCVVCGEAEEITEPTIVVSTVEVAEAGDEIEVTVNLKNIPEPGLIGVMVEIVYDHDVMELVTYYDEDEEMWYPQIEVGVKYDVSSNKYITFAAIDEVTGKSDRCFVRYLRSLAKPTQVRTEEHFFTATFKIKEDAPCGTYPLTVKYDPKNFINVDKEQVAFAAIDGSVTVHHKYVGVETQAPTCTTAGEMTYTCTSCEASYTEAISPLGHKYDEVVILAPTCTVAGEKEYTCSACGDVKTESIPVTHTYRADGNYAVCVVCGEAEEITEPTIVVSTAEVPDAGDEIEVEVKLLNNPGLIGAMVEIEYDHDVMELVTYYDEDEEMWYPQIEVGSKYNASGNKYIMFASIDEETGKSDRCFVRYLRATATATQVRTEEHFFTATFKIKEDVPCGTYPLTVKYDPRYFINVDQEQVAFGAIDGSVTINSGKHEYDNAVDTDCNSCGTIRKVANPITFGGNSVSELRHGLAFKFNVAANGIVWNEEYIADYSNATIIIDGTEYKLIGMGAIANNKGYAAQTLEDVDGKYVLNIPAEKVFEDAEGATSYAVRILNIPEAQLDTEITVCSYFQYEEGGEIITVYGEDWTTSYNAELN